MTPIATLLGLALATQAAGPDGARPFGEAAVGCEASYPLRLKNLRLLDGLRQRLRAEGYGPWLRGRRLAVSIVDLSPPDRVHYAGINDDEMFYAASLPKIVAALAVAQAAKENKVKWTPEVSRRLSTMINASNNADASWAFELVGANYLEDIVRRPGYCFYGDEHGGLWLGRPYKKGGETNRDPLHSFSHGATSRQVARFYTLLHKGLLVGPVGNKRLLSVMGPPTMHHKFVGALEDRWDVRFIARKSGSWRTFHSDSALIEHGDSRFVVVALSDHRSGAAAVEAVARIADDLIRDGAHRGSSSR